MITLYNDKQDCCGCTACKSICPEHAITMEPDEEGFLYPKIDQGLCIDCGLCKKVCPFQNGVDSPDRFPEPLVFAVKHKEDRVKMNSASGGVYTAFSDRALEISYAVYGVEFSEKFYVQHNRATNAAERDKFRGSKYVQSDLRDAFRRVRDDLNNDKGVLFTGTGCQIAGLKKYIEKTKTDFKRLITNDIVCHGTPSPLLWDDYLKFIQREDELESYTFRNKENGWHGYNVKAEFKNGKVKLNTPKVKVYANLFSSDLALRPSCYNCKFTNLRRPSDITIGDFWGIEKTMPEIGDNKGISLVLVNTPKGKDVFEKIKDDILFWESNTKDCLQLNLQQPTKKPGNISQFWEDYHRFGFDYIAKKYAGYSIIGRSKQIAVIFLKRFGLLELIMRMLKK